MMRRFSWFAFFLFPMICWVCGCGGGGGGNGILPPGPPGPPGPGNTGTVLGQVVLNGIQRPQAIKLQAASNFRCFVQDTDLSSPVNGDGTFRIDGVPLGPQVISVLDSANGAGAHVVVNVEPDRSSNCGLIAPQPAGLIAGIVSAINADGSLSPLGNARVVATPVVGPAETLGELANGRPHLVGRTNDNGEYLIRGVLPGEYLLSARRRGFVEGTQVVEVGARRTTAADFLLEPSSQGSASVSGRVDTTVEGQSIPLPGTFVVLQSDDPIIGPLPLPGDTSVATLADDLPPAPPGLERRLRIQRMPVKRQRPFILPRLFAITGSDGRYEISGVPSGRYTMFFFKSGFSSDTRPLEVAANASIVLDVTLRDISGIVSGTVSDSQTTRPIAGAGVIAFNGDPFIAIEGGMGEGEPGGGANGLASRRLQMRPPAPPTAGGISLFPPVRYFDETNEQGGYEIVVEEGDYTVVAFARGHQEQAQNTSVTAGQQQTVNFQLAPGGDEGGGGGGGLPVPLRFMSRR